MGLILSFFRWIDWPFAIDENISNVALCLPFWIWQNLLGSSKKKIDVYHQHRIQLTQDSLNLQRFDMCSGSTCRRETPAPLSSSIWAMFGGAIAKSTLVVQTMSV
jgi:hypothetical protein